MEKSKYIYLVAGEASGDLYGSWVIKKLKNRNPNLIFKGIGGNEMINSGLDPIFTIKKLSFMGFWEVLKNIFTIYQVFKVLKNKIAADKPSVILMIDFSEFNMRFSAFLRKNKVPVKIIRLVSPQVWASRKGRISKVASIYDSLLCILPFEKELYKDYPLDCHFVGHPLLEQYKLKYNKFDFLKTYNLDSSKKTIAIFPGSRQQEIDRHLPIIIEAIKKIGHVDKQFILTKPFTVNLKKFLTDLERLEVVIIDSSESWDCLSHSDLVWCKSGTSTFQAAIANTPAIIFYKTSFLTYYISKKIITVSYIGLPNIIANQEIYPELIQYDFIPQKLCYYTDLILENKDNYRSIMMNSVKNMLSIFKEQNVSDNIANIVYRYWENQNH